MKHSITSIVNTGFNKQTISLFGVYVLGMVIAILGSNLMAPSNIATYFGIFVTVVIIPLLFQLPLLHKPFKLLLIYFLLMGMTYYLLMYVNVYFYAEEVFWGY